MLQKGLIPNTWSRSKGEIFNNWFIVPYAMTFFISTFSEDKEFTPAYTMKPKKL